MQTNDIYVIISKKSYRSRLHCYPDQAFLHILKRNKKRLFKVVLIVTEVTDSLAMTHTLTFIITAEVLNTLAETKTLRVKNTANDKQNNAN